MCLLYSRQNKPIYNEGILGIQHRVLLDCNNFTKSALLVLHRKKILFDEKYYLQTTCVGMDKIPPQMFQICWKRHLFPLLIKSSIIAGCAIVINPTLKFIIFITWVVKNRHQFSRLNSTQWWSHYAGPSCINVSANFVTHFDNLQEVLLTQIYAFLAWSKGALFRDAHSCYLYFEKPHFRWSRNLMF